MAHTDLENRLQLELAAMEEAGTYKHLRYLSSPTGPLVQVEGKGEVILLSSNNYLGLANHPQVVAAGIEGLQHYGAGTASVRFICGTFTVHRELEQKLANFVGIQAALTYVSCWNANEGLMPLIVGEGDCILSDELNHASIIDACRLTRRAERSVYKHSDMADLEAKLIEHASARVKVIVTDGVFSMEGDIARLPEICALARQYQAVVVMDDSHGTGVLGATGRGTAEHFNMLGQVDIITSTLGKALGGAAGGFVAASRPIIDYLIQRSRPQLFSNALPTSVACSALKAVDILLHEPERVSRLHDNVTYFRTELKKLGYQPLESPSAIIPIIVGDTARAIRLSEKLYEAGVWVTGFGYPVVPEGSARLRVQISAAHTKEHLQRALAAFAALRV